MSKRRTSSGLTRGADAPALAAVLLDVDGTLIDSNEAHARAWEDTLRAHGWAEVSWREILPLIGMGGDKLLPRVTAIEITSPRGKALAKERTEHFLTAYAPTIRAFPGTRPLLEAIRDRGLKRVIATSANEDELEILLERAGVADLITRETNSDDAKGKSKPDPNIIVAALAKARAAAGEAIMIGDTPYDVAAAAQAGVKTIAFRCGGWGDEPLAGAAAIYAGPEELLDRIDESPLGLAPDRQR